MAIKNTLLGGTDNVNGDIIDADDVNDTNDAIIEYEGFLGEVRMFALSVSGAVTKASLQGRGWAICDGTDIVTTQGITGADITGNTPDLQEKFLRMSDDETSGTTGGKDNVMWVRSDDVNSSGMYGRKSPTHNDATDYSWDSSGSNKAIPSPDLRGDFYTETNIPAYYEVAYFMKVKL